MNSFTGTGWLQKEAWTATVPTTMEQILLFDLYLAHDDHLTGMQAAPWRCEITQLAIKQRHAAKLIPGAAVMVRGELMAKPYIKNGVHSGFTRYIAVDRLEFSRLPAPAEPAVQETAEAKA